MWNFKWLEHLILFIFLIGYFGVFALISVQAYFMLHFLTCLIACSLTEMSN